MTKTREHPLPLALTMGEPAGIGGEIALAAWSRRDIMQPFFMIDDPERLRALASQLDVDVTIETISGPADAQACFADALPVLPLSLNEPAEPGVINPKNAEKVFESIERAVDLVMEKKAAGLVTNPINKKALYDAGFSFPGHTEYLGDRAGEGFPPYMMLACESLRVVLVTIHVPLRDVAEKLRTDDIHSAVTVTTSALKTDFAIPKPRIAVAGLNPHAGEEGSMGDEEQTIIAPAIKQAKAEGIDVWGPAPPDTLFHEAARNNYDAVVCMYHDQGLIPLKTIDFYGGVNITLNLPFVRTSPDHGTALDIAGQGKANAQSLMAALRMAGEIAHNRQVAGFK